MTARLGQPALGRLLASTAIAALVLATVSFAMASHGASRLASANVSFTAGSFSSSNSRNGAAIFVARNVRPGGATSGQVTIANSGQVAGAFSLAQNALSDGPGPAGGQLSELAQLSVSDVTRADAPTPVYTGSLGAMPKLQLGTFSPGEAHTYSFTVSLPTSAPSGADLNVYQSSALQVGYAWTSTGEAPPSSAPAPATTAPSDPPPKRGSPPPTKVPNAPPGTRHAAGPSPNSPATASPAPASSPAPGAGATPHPGAQRRAATRPLGPGNGTAGLGATPGGPGSTGSAQAGPHHAAGTGRHDGHGRGRGHAQTTGARAPHDPSSKSLLSSLLSMVQRAASAVVKHGAFPFTLLLIMLAFFYLQYWLDRRDPKLALAPVDPEPSRSFE